MIASMREIVAASIREYVTNDPRVIVNALRAGEPVRFLDRSHAKRMASIFPSERWRRMAESPTLFKIDDNGEIVE